MSATYLPQKTKYRITLDLEVMEDFNPHNIDWEKVLDVQGGELVRGKSPLNLSIGIALLRRDNIREFNDPHLTVIFLTGLMSTNGT